MANINHNKNVSVKPAVPPIEHGGDLATARALYPLAPEPWIDLSTGINPHAYSLDALQADFSRDAFTRLPSKTDCAALEATAARAYGVEDARKIMAAPGAQALIQLLPRLFQGQTIGILSPTYGEYAAVWRAAGRSLLETSDLNALAQCDVAIIVNPNNPDGRIVPREKLRELAKKTRLVVDESFADFTPDVSFASLAAESNALVLRSFGKTYGLAGVRLGFAIASKATLAALAQLQGPWAVSGPAIALGRRALADGDWLKRMAQLLSADGARLDALLQAAGFTSLGGAHLFRYVEKTDAAFWAQRLGGAGIYVRAFSAAPHRLRFGLPPMNGWARLEAALTFRPGE